MRSGVRCADTTRISKAIPRSCSVVAAARIVSKSDVDPMMIPTRGLSLIARGVRAAAGDALARPGMGRPRGVGPVRALLARDQLLAAAQRDGDVGAVRRGR